MLRFDKRRTRWSVWHGVVLLGLTFLGPPPTTASADEPSAGVLLRRARYALAAGQTDDAAAALRSARKSEPRSRRGLEAALLLADLEFSRGAATQADAVLGAAERDFPDGDASAQILLARGWLALTRPDGAAALRHFSLVASRSAQRFATELAVLGSAWARLVADQAPGEVPAELAALAASASDPVLRTAAALTLARVHGVRGEHKKALRKLRALRRVVRGTSFADDVELGIGLAQLDLGAPAAARKTFRRLAVWTGGPGFAAASPSAPTLTLVDLRLPPRSFAARLAHLYAGRPERSADLLTFFAGALDRPARADAAAALGLADAAMAARKGA